jgi:hypothetical protein
MKDFTAKILLGQEYIKKINLKVEQLAELKSRTKNVVVKESETG